MKPYQLNIPAKIYFGRDIWEDAIRDIASFLNGNVMIVTTGRSLMRLGYIENLKRQIVQCGNTKNIVVFDKVSSNPRLSEVREGVQLAKESSIDVIVGFGGGSAIDMAKAVAAGAGVSEDIGEYFYNDREPMENVLPVVAIPTTAGTGSELSKAAIITDDEKKIKSGIRGRKLYPKIAIVDSIFTESVPLNITMETGFDVLAHAIESYISKAASPYTQMQSEYAVQIVGEMLPRLTLDINDIDARNYMSYASMIMGINLGNAGTGLPHRLQYPLGALTDISHGLGLAALYPAWIDYEYKYSKEKLKKIMGILIGKNICSRDDCTSTMFAFLEFLNLPTSLQMLNIEMGMEQIDEMAGAVSGNLLNDPASQEDDIITKIYTKAWVGI